MAIYNQYSPVKLSDWELDIGHHLGTLKKPKGVFQGGGDLRSKLPQLTIIKQPLGIRDWTFRYFVKI